MEGEQCMNIPFDKIIEKKILLPLHNYPASKFQFDIEDIVIFEYNDIPLAKQSLVFFSRNYSSVITLELLTHLSALSCAVVFHDDDPVLEQVEKLSQNLSLVLLKIPFHASISSCIKQCYDIALNESMDIAKFSFESMQTFFNGIMRHKKENMHIMNISMELLGCPIAFATSDFQIHHFPSIPQKFVIQMPFYASNEGFDWMEAMNAFRPNTSKLQQKLATGINGQPLTGYHYQNPYLKKQKRHALIFPIEELNVCYGYILIAPQDGIQNLTTRQSIVIQQLQVIMKLEISKQDELAQTINRYYDFILDELLKSDDTNFETLIEKYGLVKKTVHDEYYVLVCGRNSQNIDTGYIFHEFLTSQRFNNIFSQLCISFNSLQLFMFEKKEAIIVLIPGSIIQDKKDIENGAAPLRSFFGEKFQGIGVSQKISKNNIRDGYFQATKCLSLSKNSPTLETFYYEDLGILKFFFDNSNNLDTAPLLQTYKQYILPIYEYDNEHGTDFLPTLSEYISCCSSTSAICEKLHIHKNTLYSRLTKISSLIKCDLSDSDVLFHANLGLKVHTLILTGILKISVK